MRTCQVKTCTHSGCIGRVCHLDKSFLTHVWSLPRCIPVGLHLQDCQKTKCIFTTPSKSSIRPCLMKPKGNFSILIPFFFLPGGYLQSWNSGDKQHFFSFEIHNPQISNEKYKYHSSLLGELKVEFVLLQGPLMPALNPQPSQFTKASSTVRSKCSQNWQTKWQGLIWRAHQLFLSSLPSCVGWPYSSVWHGRTWHPLI